MISFVSKLKMLNEMDSLISLGKTGSPAEFAEKLHCTVATIYANLRYMRNEAAACKIIIVAKPCIRGLEFRTFVSSTLL